MGRAWRADAPTKPESGLEVVGRGQTTYNVLPLVKARHACGFRRRTTGLLGYLVPVSP